MDWYKKYSGKTKRDRGRRQNVNLWHVSPERLNVLTSRSNLGGKSGLFLSQSYRSTILDWASYVANKKHKDNPIVLKRRELSDKLYDFDALMDKGELTEEQELERSKVEAEFEKVMRTLNSPEYQKSTPGYKTLNIHKVVCPKDVYEESMKQMDDLYESLGDKANMGFWGWGRQVFIPSDLLSECQIVSTETITEAQFLKKYRDLASKRYKRW
jgi:hypothetical protein